jgi:hypothetical protein
MDSTLALVRGVICSVFSQQFLLGLTGQPNLIAWDLTLP